MNAGAGPGFFTFVQFEYPWVLGPGDGRYVIREHTGEPPAWVLVLATLGSGRRRRRRRRARPEPPPSPVTITRATLVGTERLGDRRAADAWLRAAVRDGADDPVPSALAALNRALHAHRAATADPYAREVAREQALVVRTGYGAGEQVAEGRWEEARERPAPATARRRRAAVLGPQERLAAVLGGRDAVLACEELAVRARGDVDQGRQREAALQLEAALRAALAELPAYRATTDMNARLAELAELEGPVGGVATAALQGGLEPAASAVVEQGLARLEAALRARSAGR